MITINFDPFPVLQTDRLVLRQLTLDDAPPLLAMRSDPRVLEHLIIPPTKTLEEAKAFIQKLIDGTKKNEWINWAICRKGDNYLMGTYVLWHIDTWNQRGEIGYMLHPDYQKKGYVQEATEAVLEYAFKTLGLHTLEAHTSPANLPSIKLLERNGFEREALFRENTFLDGKFLDTAVYGLINPFE